PIVAPGSVPWGQKAFSRYLGPDESTWRPYDACALMESRETYPGTILIDQGMGDQFLTRELQPERFEQACAHAGQPLQLRHHQGYDHGYWFVSTFIEDHLRHHAGNLV